MGHLEDITLQKYYNDTYVRLKITAYDYIGNKMFEDQVFYYRLGEHVRWTIPQFADYYIAENDLDFCIQTSMEINLIYKHLIKPHINITDYDEDKVVYCGPLTSFDHVINYEDRANVNRIAEIPCIFEGEVISFKYPKIEGYYTEDEYVELTVTENIVLHKKYHKLQPVTINFISEFGENLKSIEKDLTEECLINHSYTYVVDSADFEEYSDDWYTGVDEVTINILSVKNNVVNVKLFTYRYVHTNTKYIDNDSEPSNYIITTCSEPDKYKIGDIYNVTVNEIDGWYTETEGYDIVIPSECKYDEDKQHYYIDVDDILYKKLITFTIYFVCNGEEIHEPLIIDNKHHNVTYTYKPLEIEGYTTHVSYYYLRGTSNRTLHIEYHESIADISN